MSTRHKSLNYTSFPSSLWVLEEEGLCWERSFQELRVFFFPVREEGKEGELKAIIRGRRDRQIWK